MNWTTAVYTVLAVIAITATGSPVKQQLVPPNADVLQIPRANSRMEAIAQMTTIISASPSFFTYQEWESLMAILTAARDHSNHSPPSTTDPTLHTLSNRAGISTTIDLLELSQTLSSQAAQITHQASQAKKIASSPNPQFMGLDTKWGILCKGSSFFHASKDLSKLSARFAAQYNNCVRFNQYQKTGGEKAPDAGVFDYPGL